MMLNEAIERHQAIAKEVHLTVTGGDNERRSRSPADINSPRN